MSNTLQNTFNMDILNTNQKFVHIFNSLRCFLKHMFYYLCEENAMISEFFWFYKHKYAKIITIESLVYKYRLTTTI